MIASFTFSQHLQTVVNVVFALNPDDVHDLLRFQRLIHHRAFRKLAWRVLYFSTHWGYLPFHILGNHLGKDLPPKIVLFKSRDPEFHSTIQSYVGDGTCKHVHSMDDLGISSEAEHAYCVNAENASEWLLAFTTLWNKLEGYLDLGCRVVASKNMMMAGVNSEGLNPEGPWQNLPQTLRQLTSLLA